jgi:predicted nucleic acid-binding protein
MAEHITTEGPLAVTEPVIMEVLAGARTDEREADLRRLLSRFELCAVHAPSDFEAAAGIYRRCRQLGVTPRGLLDCLIAAVAWRVGASLLCQDVDLERVAGVVGLTVD